MSTDLSIITVNYNSGDLLLGCLRAVFEHTANVEFEYFVVDNASRRDGFLAKARKEYPQVQVLENETNVGFAAGCNVALEHARGRYVLLLNPDTAVGPQALPCMIRFMDTRPDIAVLGSPLCYSDGRDQGVAGRGFPTPLAGLFGRTSLLTKLFPGNRFSAKFSSKRDPDRREPYAVDWVSGACMLIRRAALTQVGPLDPGFFFMWEDTDFCKRMRHAGWQVYCYHEANVMHCEGGSRNRGWHVLWVATVAFHQGAYRYYRKHINARVLDPTHLLVMGALAARTLLVLATRSLHKIWSACLTQSKCSAPPPHEDHTLNSSVTR